MSTRIMICGWGLGVLRHKDNDLGLMIHFWSPLIIGKTVEHIEICRAKDRSTIRLARTHGSARKQGLFGYSFGIFICLNCTSRHCRLVGNYKSNTSERDERVICQVRGVKAFPRRCCFLIKWICSAAPTRPVTVVSGFPCIAWFDVRELVDDGPDDYEGLDVSAAHIANLFSAEPRDVKVGIGGFSMGSAIAVYSWVVQLQSILQLMLLWENMETESSILSTYGHLLVSAAGSQAQVT